MDIVSMYAFYLVYICGLIGKICNHLHCQAYFHRLVRDFVGFFLVIIITICNFYCHNKYFYSILITHKSL